ncbi:MAG: hypothetical protein ABR593_08045 [Candidatus Limnocylindria bacterium]
MAGEPAPTTATPEASRATPEASRANTALAVAVVAAVFYVAAMIFDSDDGGAAGLLWPLSGLTGAAAAYLAWKAGAPRRRGRALAAFILGGLLFLMILGWVVVAAFTGDL